MLVETKDCSLLMDPWLIGSCYWRSWWNYPPPPSDVIDGLVPDFIYVTHLHWDHFHSPSLKRFDPATPILVPKAHFTRMVEDLGAVGFHNVHEIPHAASRTLKGGPVVTSYQFGLPLDSALVVETSEGVLFNANDCKLMGAPLRQVAARHPRIDFVFKSHSSANPYPFCVSSEFPEHLKHRSNEDYAREFLAFAELLRARHAIPFASNHCFLHRETRRFNETIVSPYDVKRYFDAHRSGASECQVMPPGASWSSTDGFTIPDLRHFFTDKAARIRELETANSGKLTAFYAKEDLVRPHWESFHRYFSKMLADLPPGFRRVLPARVLFRVSGAGSADWLVDFGAHQVRDRVDPAESHDLRVDVHANVLRDCCQKRMFSVFTASKRVHFHLVTKRALRYFFIMSALMDMYESDYLPLRMLLRRRFLSNWARRWREVLFYASVALSMAIGRSRLRPIDHIR